MQCRLSAAVNVSVQMTLPLRVVGWGGLRGSDGDVHFRDEDLHDCIAIGDIGRSDKTIVR